MGLFAAAYAVQAVLRLHSEEESGRAEPIVAAAVSRIRWASSHLVVACGGSALLMVVLGLSAGAGQATASNTGAHAMTSLVGACLAQLPAVWLLAGVTLLLFGVAPRWSMAAWVVYGLVFVVGVVVPAAWPASRLVDLSPFTHIPKLPGATISWPPLVWLSVSVAASIAIGLVALRRRDLR
jgi:ABC-2 type transport system permease protein